MYARLKNFFLRDNFSLFFFIMNDINNIILKISIIRLSLNIIKLLGLFVQKCIMR